MHCNQSSERAKAARENLSDRARPVYYLIGYYPYLCQEIYNWVIDALDGTADVYLIVPWGYGGRAYWESFITSGISVPEYPHLSCAKLVTPPCSSGTRRDLIQRVWNFPKTIKNLRRELNPPDYIITVSDLIQSYRILRETFPSAKGLVIQAATVPLPVQECRWRDYAERATRWLFGVPFTFGNQTWGGNFPSDSILVWSKHFCMPQFKKPAARVHVFGNLRIDRHETPRKSLPAPQPPRVTIFGAGYETILPPNPLRMVRRVYSELVDLAKAGRISLKFKPHPRYKVDQTLKAINADIEYLKGSVREALEQTDIYVGSLSSTILDALAFGCRVFVIDLPGMNLGHFVDLRCVTRISSAEEILSQSDWKECVDFLYEYLGPVPSRENFLKIIRQLNNEK